MIHGYEELELFSGLVGPKALQVLFPNPLLIKQGQ